MGPTLFAVLFLTGTAFLAVPPQAWSAETVSGPLTVERVSLPDRKAVFATVESTDILLARARIGGTVGELSVDEGDSVTAEQKLAVVGDQKLILQMQGVDARMRSMTAELNQAQVDLGRTSQLRKQGVVAQAQLDMANTQVRVLKQNLEALDKERAVLAQQVTEGAILSPGAGRVLEVTATDGAVIMAGESIATIASDSYILRMRLPERHARFIKIGDAVEVGPRGLGASETGTWTKGQVVQVYPKLDAGRVVADVKVAGLGDYFVGERTLVHVATGARETILVPAAYLENRHGLTYATLENGTPVVVQTGPARSDGVEVLSGLRAGDVLVPPGAVLAETAPAAGDAQ
ncbi:MAG: efflux RND transporter periplasmic adaptor subunit [Rhodospirillum sp.]|nr:efflux RND transporter periplasmic adaptor subunit [Rhodospirillum sp.]MCF8489912.1 efflux RND transporter periplasmic adaptor subunit [Rhodospirillum sp.]MCF8501793.1 efflux RND transporter periplasmic adaptor subunit [Rhodospirillum sp.]